MAALVRRSSACGTRRDEPSKDNETLWRWHCPKFIRQSVVEFAGKSIVYSEWARIYYEEQIKRGKGHHAAVRALAYKWIRVIFYCWKQKAAYDEKTYTASLSHHGSWIADKLKKTA
ncbi:MAG: hypothetical protein WC340_09685 [Kiritimatiellia bacterium]